MNDIPQIIISDIVFTEPTTFFTDLLVSVLCFVFAFKLYKTQEPSAMHSYRLLFFLLLGVSSFVGGLEHLLSNYMSKNVAYGAWIASSISIFSLEMWSLSFLQKNRLTSVFYSASLLILFSSIAGILILQTFFPVVIRSVVGLFAIVLPARLQVKNQLDENIFKFFSYAVGFSILSGIAYIPALSIHKWFNNADLGHVLLAVSVYFFYRMARVEQRTGF